MVNQYRAVYKHDESHVYHCTVRLEDNGQWTGEIAKSPLGTNDAMPFGAGELEVVKSETEGTLKAKLQMDGLTPPENITLDWHELSFGQD